jgi:indolepyruvate ferredoxin oxidoreductase beta subunit
MDKNMPRKLDILLVGVGGQGVVLASDVLGEVALAGGYDVKKTDTLGMAQRGGSVVAHVRMGEQVASPQIPLAGADILLAFEKSEALRWLDYLSPAATIIINNQAILPLTAATGEQTYPTDEQITQALSQYTREIYPIEGPEIASEIGNQQVTNVVLLGALSIFLPFAPEGWEEVLKRQLPEKFHQLNLTAFQMGRREIMHIFQEMAEHPPEEEEGGHDHGDSCGCG